MVKKLNTLRDNSVEDLEAKIVDLRQVLSKERAATASGTRAEKPSRIRNTRREIARILTIVNQKKRGRNVKNG